jgi:glutamate--cysteine ligase
MALPALWVGLLYDAQARAGATALLSHLSFAQLLELQARVAKESLAARVPGPGGAAVVDLARELVSLARGGLSRWAAESGADEGHLLDPLEELARGGVPLSEKLLLFWKRANRDAAAVINLSAIA